MSIANQPLVLVAGWGFRASVWTDLLGHLPPNPRTTVLSAFELLAEPDPAQALLSVLQSQGEPTVLIGWSMGGMLALEALAAQASLAALVLIGSTARFCADQDYLCGTPPEALRAMRLGLRRDPSAVLDGFLSACATHPGQVATLQQHAWVDEERMRLGLDYLSSLDLRSLSILAPPPTLILHGKADRIVPVNAARVIKDLLLPKAELVRLEAIGHDLPTAAARLTAGMIAEFSGRALS
jgi:pimeloyl-[acyl-carrier protein] methyl ester esterase